MFKLIISWQLDRSLARYQDPRTSNLLTQAIDIKVLSSITIQEVTETNNKMVPEWR